MDFLSRRIKKIIFLAYRFVLRRKIYDNLYETTRRRILQANGDCSSVSFFCRLFSHFHCLSTRLHHNFLNSMKFFFDLNLKNLADIAAIAKWYFSNKLVLADDGMAKEMRKVCWIFITLVNFKSFFLVTNFLARCKSVSPFVISRSDVLHVANNSSTLVCLLVMLWNQFNGKASSSSGQSWMKN